MDKLKDEMKENSLQPCYLFYGEEKYLKEQYEKKIIKLFDNGMGGDMNINIFGEDTPINTIMDICETLPFFAEKRLIIVKDSKLFKAGRKDDSENMGKWIATVPESACLIFIEEEIDKRNKLYKEVNKKGRAVDFKTPDEKGLVKWIQKEFKKNKIDIKAPNAIYFLRHIGTNMENANTEMMKLVSYKGSGGEITAEDIEDICTKSLEAKVFELVDKIGKRQTKEAVLIYKNMLVLKESPIGILAMIIRQFRIMLQCKVLGEQGQGVGLIASNLGLKEFVVRQAMSQSKNFTKETLEKGLRECLESDIGIKTGMIKEDVAVELIIIKYSN